MLRVSNDSLSLLETLVQTYIHHQRSTYTVNFEENYFIFASYIFIIITHI